ncbi:MAG: tetratricopeptide repeat protein [Candidatus Marinimicrobia bacterium]|nr:tetratricopeptide repeat protein [Candidatus Neomarinimicrobiota bacterium]
MKKIIPAFLFLTILTISCNKTSDSTDGKYIQWSGENEVANAMVRKGVRHFNNAELEQAYSYFAGSLEVDSTLFASHVVLAWLTPDGEADEMHKSKARELVKGKNENSNLMVSLLDINLPAGEERRAKRHEIWSKMHEIEPDGKFIHFFYARTMPTARKRINEMEVLLEENKETGRAYSHILNVLGYLHYAEDEKAIAKSYFDKYLEAYPEGYNPPDSMGEFYFNEKEYETALKYYEKALDKYPFSVSATNKVKEINELLDN